MTFPGDVNAFAIKGNDMVVVTSEGLFVLRASSDQFVRVEFPRARNLTNGDVMNLREKLWVEDSSQ